MVKIIPTFNSCSPCMTGGERRIAQSLEQNLEDDYTIWYDVPIGNKNLRPDFIILHPERGLLVLEVKDWKISIIQDANRKTFKILTDEGIKSVDSPLEQARKFVLAIKQLLSQDLNLVQPTGRYAGQLICPYGYGIVLSNITRKVFLENELDSVFGEHLVICQDEINPKDPIDLQERLWAMYPYSFDWAITPEQVDRIRWLMFPECRFPSKKLASFLADRPLLELDPDKEGDLSVTPIDIPIDLIKIFDLQQETLARSLGDGHRVIHGVAGSGKTMILLYRCKYLAALEPERPILVVCFNVALGCRLREIIASENLDRFIHVRHFHGWCQDQIRRHRISLPRDSSSSYITNLESEVWSAINDGRIPTGQYSSILIDEGHDFSPEWFTMLIKTLDESDSLLLLYDDAQNLYGNRERRKKFSFKSVGIKAQGRSSILKVNYRNPVKVLNLAYTFAQDIMQPTEAEDDGQPLVKPASAGTQGATPKLSRCRDLAAEIDLAIATVRQLQSDGVLLNEIGIFYGLRFIGEKIDRRFQSAGIPIEWLNKDAQSRFYQPKANSVKLMTLHSCKGLEFANVIIPGIGYFPTQNSNPADDARLLYVGMTRSTNRLQMSFHQKSEFVQKLVIALNSSSNNNL